MADEVVNSPAPVTKNLWVSKGVIGGALAVVASVVSLVGIGFSAEDAAAIGAAFDVLQDKMLEIIGIAGGVLAIIGRIKADSKIKFPWQKD